MYEGDAFAIVKSPVSVPPVNGRNTSLPICVHARHAELIYILSYTPTIFLLLSELSNAVYLCNIPVPDPVSFGMTSKNPRYDVGKFDTLVLLM